MRIHFFTAPFSLSQIECDRYLCITGDRHAILFGRDELPAVDGTDGGAVKGAISGRGSDPCARDAAIARNGETYDRRTGNACFSAGFRIGRCRISQTLRTHGDAVSRTSAVSISAAIARAIPTTGTGTGARAFPTAIAGTIPCTVPTATAAAHRDEVDFDGPFIHRRCREEQHEARDEA